VGYIGSEMRIWRRNKEAHILHEETEHDKKR
jgi:hypothetical protein